MLPSVTKFSFAWFRVADGTRGSRIWIREHQRGDASLGFVTHDYSVKHEHESEEI